MTDRAIDDKPQARIANFIGMSCFSAVLAGVLAAGHSLVSVTPFPPGIQPVYREIGEWLVACDNTRQCVAKYVLGDHDGDTSAFNEDAGLTISREAGPSGDILVEVTSGSKFDPGTIRVDGMALVGRFTWDSDDEGRGASIDGDAAMAFVRRLRDASAASWSGSGHASTISLRGLAAVLVAMDEDARTDRQCQRARARWTSPSIRHIGPGCTAGRETRAQANAAGERDQSHRDTASNADPRPCGP